MNPDDACAAGALDVRLLDHVRGARLFEDPGTALLAVSGGPDSVALLDLFVRVGATWGLEVVVGHVDHGITSDSRELARHVCRIGRQYGVPVVTERLELGPDASETRARAERYRVLRAMQRRVGARYLVTAHHADDQVETVVYRLLRGSGVAGLAGIPERGPDGLVRPLLPFTKEELGAWLARDGAPHVQAHADPANHDPRHDRSWLRTAILPQVRRRLGSGTDRRVRKTAEAASQDRRAWSQLLYTLPELEFSRHANGVEVARAPFERYDKVLSDVLLRAVAREAGCHPGVNRTARLLDFITAGSSGRVLELGDGWEAELAFERMRITHRARAPRPARHVTLDVREPGQLTWGPWEFRWRPEIAGVPRRKSGTTWLTAGVGALREFRPGDRIFPLGGVGHRKVRRVLMEARVASRDRPIYPVVVRGDEVLWIPGVCRAAGCVPAPGEPAVRLDAYSSERPEGRHS